MKKIVVKQFFGGHFFLGAIFWEAFLPWPFLRTPFKLMFSNQLTQFGSFLLELNNLFCPQTQILLSGFGRTISLFLDRICKTRNFSLKIIYWYYKIWRFVNNFENINLNNNGGLSFTVNQENPVENIFKKLAGSNRISDENKSVKPTAWKVSKYGVFSLLHFPVFGLNTMIYFVNLSI